MKDLSRSAKLYISVVLAVGLAVLTATFFSWDSSGWPRFAAYLVVALLASGFKVTLPGITGTMSVCNVFVLLGVIEMSRAETVVLGCVGVIAQTYWHAKKRPHPIQALFNISNIATAAAAAYPVYGLRSTLGLGSYSYLLLGASAAIYFFLNTLPIAGVVALTEHRNARRVWSECYFWSFPYYLLAAFIATVVSRLNQYFDWQISMLALPALYLIYRSYTLYLLRLEAEKRHAEDEQKRAEDQQKHAEEMAALHLRTIEAMALAIDAKDSTTHEHLQRVQVYAVAMGQELGVSGAELEALRAAAILHDIGKLAVPEHILSKPGRLTPEEFEKIKVHPVVGAAILERVQFPYPVVPIVRYHHERWDGTGYPEGLAGESIPIGARILAAVDCLDALASDRQYRRAVPIDDAMQMVADGAGKSFDRKVVEALQRRYKDLEQVAQRAATTAGPVAASRNSHGPAPAAGFETLRRPTAREPEFLLSIAAAREEMQMLYELSNDLGNSLSLQQTLTVLDARLKRLIRYDTMAVYVIREQVLVPEYTQGADSQFYSSLEIPVGQGLSGWVAENAKPVINGEPSVEWAHRKDRSTAANMRSAMAAPLEGVDGTIGVLTLYSAEQNAFSRDDLRVLLAISSKAGLATENALRHRQAELSATTDGLTGLPNARSLFLRLDAEVSRCRRDGKSLAILVCDLDGFKQVNDRYGHLEGNRVLKLVARGLLDHCREYDYVARMGGDEFVLMLPGASPDAVENRTVALDQMVRRVGVDVCGEEILSISVGAAYYPQHGADAEQLLASADRCMYKRKQERKAMRVEQRSMAQLALLSRSIQ